MAGATDHRLVYSDPFSYCAHAHAVMAGSEVLVVFNRAPRRSLILHPAQDPYYENVITRSRDGARSWTTPSVVPDYGWSGVECAGLTVTRRGAVLLNQSRFRWYPLSLARRRAGDEKLVFPKEWVGTLAASLEIDSGAALARDPDRLAPWVRGLGGTYVHLSEDFGETFALTVEIATAPYSGGYGMRGAVECDDGTLVLPLSDVPHYERVFVVRSPDGGTTWGPPIPAAERPGCFFEEPAPLLLPSGRILLGLRDNASRSIMTTFSDDGGLSWSAAEPTGIDGYPAHLLRLADGRILCTYGVRKPPFAIRAVLSEDDGASWHTARPIAIRDRLPNKNLGYPCTLQLPDGGLITIYYAEDDLGTTGIWASAWSPG